MVEIEVKESNKMKVCVQNKRPYSNAVGEMVREHAAVTSKEKGTVS